MEDNPTTSWIRLAGADSMPAKDKMVLLFIPDSKMKYQIGYWNERFLNSQDKVTDYNPTHWLELSPPPDEK